MKKKKEQEGEEVKYPKIEWFDVEDELPKGQHRVLVMATAPNYQFGYPQMLSGFFMEEYYDTIINRFRITGVDDRVWTVIKWAYAPIPPSKF